ncbi:WG repeat-containing protein [Oscillospiraceae bacterium CM]|nr:WG repeat-containing protein [Oscillospiraceae bacterium CM]
MKGKIRRFWPVFLLLPALLLSACKNNGAAPTPAATDWHSGVKTDYSKLASYTAPAEKYTRLKDGPLAALTPSASYGRLLPYAGQPLYTDSGYVLTYSYGLITESGMIVTDPIYESVFEGYGYQYGRYDGIDTAKAYNLSKIIGTVDEDNPRESIRYAACALDGSWITPFDYQHIIYMDNVMLLVRNDDKNDIDVMNYSGKLLYNIKALSCYDLLPSDASYTFQYGGGFLAVKLDDGNAAFIDVLTGKVTYTAYTDAYAFSEGYAAVQKDGLYGYISTDFSMLITPQFKDAQPFVSGKAIVTLADGTYAVIDTGGKTLIKNNYAISLWGNGIYSFNNGSYNQTYYDSNFKKISPDNPEAILLSDGWFYAKTKDGTVLSKGSEKHTYPGDLDIGAVVDGLVSYNVYNDDTWSEGVMTLDGKTVIPLTTSANIQIAQSASGQIFFIINEYGDYADVMAYQILTRDGKTIAAGTGYANFDTTLDLFEINSNLSYAYLNTAGADVFRLSHLAYLPD